MNISAFSSLEHAWSLRNSDSRTARSLSEQAQAEAGSERRAVAAAKVVLSYLDYRARRYEEAVTAGLDALAVLETNPSDPWLPRLYNTLAIIHMDLGERAAARVYLDKQIRLSRNLGDQTYEALGYHDLGLLQAAVDRQRGLSTLAQARTIFQADGDRENEALTLYNIANIYHHAGEHDVAGEYAAEARDLLWDHEADGLGRLILIYLATQMAERATARGRFSEAEALLDDAHTLAAQHLPEQLPHVQFCRGLFLAATGADEAARGHFEAALAQLGSSAQYELLADCHAALADCNERLGDYQAALRHHRSFATIREQTFAEASEQKVRALEVIHQIESARRMAEAECRRNAELRKYITELEHLQATLHNLSLRDPLTNLFNRRALFEQGKRLLDDARRNGRSLCVAMLDLDHFKSINDQFGHQVGDQVLQQVSLLVTGLVRATDIVARYGGEEIALVLPYTDGDKAYEVCERLRGAIERYEWDAIAPTLRVTLSIGLTDDGSSFEELLARADQQLYASKGAGRNCISYDQRPAH